MKIFFFERGSTDGKKERKPMKKVAKVQAMEVVLDFQNKRCYNEFASKVLPEMRNAFEGRFTYGSLTCCSFLAEGVMKKGELSNKLCHLLDGLKHGGDVWYEELCYNVAEDWRKRRVEIKICLVKR